MAVLTQPAAASEYVVDFPTLWVAVDWAEAHCIVPDGLQKGQPFANVDWQAWGLLNFYRLKPSAAVGQLAPAFFWRRSQIVLPQKAGKAPYTAEHICIEAVGPALFAGWARGGEVWDCREHGCGCGWVYEYSPGEAMGRQWPTPLIQITATAEDQTDNIYSALRPMIDQGPLSALIPKTGEEFIRLPNDGRIDVVTSNARARLGARVTFVPQDETGLWTASAGMIKVAETQRRGLAGMGGRAEETTNAWDPNEGSVAQRTAAATTGDIFRIHPLPAKGLKYTVKAERRKIHRFVYAGCHWVDLDSIEGEAAELIAVDAAQAERFFGNRPVAGSGRAFDADRWAELAAPRRVSKGATIVIGVDGARFDDALAIIATEVRTGYQWTLKILERPDDADDDYEHDFDAADGAVADAFDRFNVWRMQCDDQYIEALVEKWQNRYGDKRVIVFHTNRDPVIAWAVRDFENALKAGDLSHDGNPVFARHIENAHKRPVTVRDDKERFMHTLSKDGDRSRHKMDGAMAAVISWDARSRAIAAGVWIGDNTPEPAEPVREPWQPGTAPPAEWLGLGSVSDGAPLGSLS